MKLLFFKMLSIFTQIPNHLLWLIWFYLCFHSYFNMLGEVLKFADRDFYGDWWNATNIDVFWRSWNMPIHRWAVRYDLP
jgi:diacylglycerol O-acyltransferase 1